MTRRRGGIAGRVAVPLDIITRRATEHGGEQAPETAEAEPYGYGAVGKAGREWLGIRCFVATQEIKLTFSQTYQ